MSCGRYRQLVTCAIAPQISNDTDGYFEDLSPPEWWVAIEPLPPGNNERTIPHLVTGRYRSDITMDVRLLYGTRALYVKGIQNVAEQNRELRCYCEEVVP